MVEPIVRNGIRWNERTISALIMLVFIPDLLGGIDLQAPSGFRLQAVQPALFLAAFLYGRWGGLISGLAGSATAAAALANPCFLAGQALLGYYTGYFTEKGFGPLTAVLSAYGVQLSWMAVSDYALTGLPMAYLGSVILTLTVSNFMWAIAAALAVEPVRRFLECSYPISADSA